MFVAPPVIETELYVDVNAVHGIHVTLGMG
jgi:hypothetical protein